MKFWTHFYWSLFAKVHLIYKYFWIILIFQVTIKNAAGLPPSLSHFVFCQYNFWGESDPTVVPPTDPDDNINDILKLGQTSDVAMFSFNHTRYYLFSVKIHNKSRKCRNRNNFLLNFFRQFVIPVTEEFMDHCSEGALSIEVYGHRSAGFASTAKWAERLRLAKSLADR